MAVSGHRAVFVSLTLEIGCYISDYGLKTQKCILQDTKYQAPLDYNIFH